MTRIFLQRMWLTSTWSRTHAPRRPLASHILIFTHVHWTQPQVNYLRGLNVLQTSQIDFGPSIKCVLPWETARWTAAHSTEWTGSGPRREFRVTSGRISPGGPGCMLNRTGLDSKTVFVTYIRKQPNRLHLLFGFSLDGLTRKHPSHQRWATV